VTSARAPFTELPSWCDYRWPSRREPKASDHKGQQREFRTEQTVQIQKIVRHMTHESRESRQRLMLA